ncbi:MAG: outer membrane protein transport protein, partial [Mariprofundales bacterium]|nr:outer membrane protein transport protein [Mariprofundales bacterium]
GYGYLTQMTHGDNFGGSLGWSMPLAVNNNWSGYGRTSLRVNRVNASLVTAIDSSLAIAIGPDWYLGTLDLTDNRGTSFNGSASSGFGGHISAMWKPLPSWSFGALYRSSASLRFSRNGSHSKIELPDSARFGAAYRINNSIRLEVDGRWTHWKKMAQISTYSSSGTLQISHNLALRNTLDLMTGLTWSWRQDTRFRFGYAYEQGAAKKSNFDPALTDLSGHRLSIGAGSNLFGVHIDAAYSYKFQPSTTATGIAGSGKLTHRRQSLGISVSQYF